MRIAARRKRLLMRSLLHLCCVVTGTLFLAQNVLAQSCPGQRDRSRPKIVGGNEAKIAHWPAQAVLRLHNPQNDQSLYLCGGAVIAPNWVITAAHCFGVFQNPDSIGQYTMKLEKVVTGLEGDAHLQVVIGAQDLAETGSGHVFEIDKAIIHGDYQSAYSGKDIALVKLKSPWNGPFATLSRSGQIDRLTEQVWVAGFGDLKFQAATKIFPTPRGGKFAAGSPNLREVRLPVVASTICAQRYGQDTIGAGQLCAGFKDGGRDSCQGDSGGPLVIYDPDQCPYQVGIVSWGEGCADANSYGVYTRVSHFADWIKQYVPDANFADEAGVSNTSKAVAAKQAAYAALAQLEDELGTARGRIEVKVRLKSGGYAAPGNRVKLKERYVFEVDSDLDGRLILVDIDAAGMVTQIYPNKFSQSQNEGRISQGNVIKLPGRGYGFDWFRAVEPLGKGKLLALVAPENFPVKIMVAAPKRLSKGFQPEQAPTSYLMNLLHQIFRTAGIKGFQAERAAPGENWGYHIMDYEVVK